MALWGVLPFQGVAVVEATTVFVLVRFGMSPEPATLISLSFRGLAFWVPLLLGFLLLRRTSSFSERPRLKPPRPGRRRYDSR